ncbi:uncharacterized protein [Nothobranchius furzeri]|uniref:uncharacterized protein isoform X1 n=2 Tax=Nothobranchius furzeri TaxID=105023 RepID=UPI003904A6A5
MKKPSVLPGSSWKIPKPRVREREVTKRKVKNNKRYLSSSDDEAGPCSTERTRVPMAERTLLLIEPSSRDVPVSKRTTLPAESLNGEDLMATSTPRQRVTPRQKATEDQAAGIADALRNNAAITDICKSLLIKVNMMEGKMHTMEKLLHNVASRHSESQTQDDLRLEPCKDAEDFTLLDNNLQDKAYFQQAVRFLSLIGGRKLGENTRRTMLAVASNAVWCGYSLHGKKQKAKLCNLKIFRLIKRAVKTLLPDSTDKDIEVQIMEVLTHAPQKVRREAEAQHRATQMEAHSSEED